MIHVVGHDILWCMFDQIRKTVSRIPRGKVATYGQVAEAAGFPGRARQVVWALQGVGETLPWHRVVGAGGKILLTGEHGQDPKLRLQNEGVAFSGSRIRLAAHGWEKVPLRKGRTVRQK